uniref:Iron hydrogenase large subunit C-terminal domain-containing protein n=1 Tax=Glossina palpalis gambiensis TaxID=67801 RepID=A0A1B0C4Y7_9MUSC
MYRIKIADLGLLEGCQEFIECFRSKSEEQPLPMLTSSCPCWVCYAEKNTFAVPAPLTTLSYVVRVYRRGYD